MITLNGNQFTEEEVFKKVIMSELAPTKPVLCKFALDLMKDIPSYFWTDAASSSGKYHPDHDLGEGGLARHSLMVYRWLKEMIEIQPDSNLDVMREFIPSMTMAALFHDSIKRGLDGSSTTVHEHPLYAAKFIIDKSIEFINNNKDFIDTMADDEESFRQDIAIVASCIQTHMGKWNTSKYSETVLPTPNDAYQQMVHIADYIASRKFTTFDYEYFAKLMVTTM